MVYEVPIRQPQNFFRVITTPKEEVYFASNSSSQGFQSGKVSIRGYYSPWLGRFPDSIDSNINLMLKLNRSVIPVDHPTAE